MAAIEPDSLERFVLAQADVFHTALSELSAGQKQSHWMWFIFPQIRGLGLSAMAHHYGIASLTEARAYLGHPLLGPRLLLSTQAVLGHRDRDLRQIFGSPDDLKFVSSMSLFATAGGPLTPFHQALEHWCGGRMDERTLNLITRAHDTTGGALGEAMIRP